jgi:PAS domain S-box-containing protein
MSGVCAYAALHHVLSVMRGRVNRVHLLFALMCLLTAALIMARVGGYGADTAAELVAARRWEIVFLCFFAPAFLWFVADYTGVYPRKLLFGLSGFWVLLFAANLVLPYGIQFVDSPSIIYFELPWGERVVDLRVLQRTFWHNLMWLGIVISLLYGLYACYLLYRRGQQRRSHVMAWALGIFSVLSLLNVAINLKLVEFVHTSDFGFLALIVVMDMEMMLESRDEKRQLRVVLDHLPVAVCLKDLKGRFQLINRKFETAFRTCEADIASKKVSDLFSREQVAIIDANERHALDTHQIVDSDEVLDCGGEPRTFQIINFPLLREDGSAYAIGGVYIDVTESRQKDEVLNRFRRQVWHADRVASTGAITSSLAHELCQPLSAMLNNAQAGLRFLAQDKVDLDEIREILQDIVRDDKRAGAVINGLRAMLQQQETLYADIDLAQCINEVITLLHSEFVRAGVEVEPMLEANLAIRANKTQIQQVALNLMINALEAMAEQARDRRMLRVTAARVKGKALVSICDSGIGIAEDMLDRVFDGFYTTKPQGLGVGLEVCRSIMESHGGRIWAEANPDRGVTFHCALPLEDKASA